MSLASTKDSGDDSQGYTIILIVMGTSGSGKSSVAEALAKKLNVSFVEGDDFHSIESKTKMSNGIPLKDEDRWPWLKSIRKYLYTVSNWSPSTINGVSFTVLSCSSLKKSYRDLLSTPPEDENKNVQTFFIYLKGDYELIHQRMVQRTKHFAKASLLESQFKTLEEPNPAQEMAVIVSIDNTLSDVIELAYEAFKSHPLIQKIIN